MAFTVAPLQNFHPVFKKYLYLVIDKQEIHKG